MFVCEFLAFGFAIVLCDCVCLMSWDDVVEDDQSYPPNDPDHPCDVCHRVQSAQTGTFQYCSESYAPALGMDYACHRSQICADCLKSHTGNVSKAKHMLELWLCSRCRLGD